MIGLVIIGLIFVPLFVLLIAALFDPMRLPRTTRVAAMFTGTFLLQVVVMIVGFAIFAVLLRFVVPQ